MYGRHRKLLEVRRQCAETKLMGNMVNELGSLPRRTVSERQRARLVEPLHAMAALEARPCGEDI